MITRNNIMPHRLTTSNELVFALITIFSTLTMTDFVLKVIMATLSYTVARLFYYYYGEKIRRIIDNLNNKIKRLRK